MRDSQTGELVKDEQALMTAFLRILPTSWRPDGKNDADAVNALNIANYTKGTDGVTRVVEKASIPFGSIEANLFRVRTASPRASDAYGQASWQPGQQNELSGAQKNAINQFRQGKISYEEALKRGGIRIDEQDH